MSDFDLDKAEQYQRLFVKPMVDALDTRMTQFMADIKIHIQPVIDGQTAQDNRLNELEKNQKKALLGWSLYATAAAGLFTYCYGWIKSKIHFG